MEQRVIIDGIPHFGTPQAGTDYISRPSVYTIIQDTNQRIAIVKHKGGFFLPGGGIEPGETQIEALEREILEELGYGIKGMVKLSEAVEYLPDISGERFYRIQSTFFKAVLDMEVSSAADPGHQLIWMRPKNAIPKMQRDCHKWAIEACCKFR